MSGDWIVRIVRTEDGHVIWESAPMSERRADKVDDGVNQILNHENYHTEMVEVAA